MCNSNTIVTTIQVILLCLLTFSYNHRYRQEDKGYRHRLAWRPSKTLAGLQNKVLWYVAACDFVHLYLAIHGKSLSDIFSKIKMVLIYNYKCNPVRKMQMDE